MKRSKTLGLMNGTIMFHESIINQHLMMNWYIAVIIFVSRMELGNGQVVTERTKQSVMGEA